MTVIGERYDVASALQTPPPPDTGAYISSLRDSAGQIIGGVDWVGEKLFGVSVIEEMVKPFAGDWAQLEIAAGGWVNAGSALDATAANFLSAGEGLAPIWQGDAASQAGLRIKEVADLHASQAEGCRLIAEQCKMIIKVAQGAGVVLASALNTINDILLRLLAKAAVPLLGWAAAAAAAPFEGTKFFLCMQRVARAISKLADFINGAMKIVGMLQQMIAAADKILSLTTRAVQFGNIQMTDEVAGAQFGVA